MQRLKKLSFTTLDFPYIKVDENGDIFFVDEFGPEPAEEDFPALLPPVGEALTELATFQLHIDLSESIAKAISQSHQSVVLAHRKKQDESHQASDNNDRHDPSRHSQY